MEKHLEHRLSWERLAEEGDELYDYLIHNYENMLDGEEKVKHFDVGYITYGLMDEVLDINKKCSNELQKELVP